MERCLWCETPFSPRRSGGKAQRFCNAQCRRNLEHFARSWAIAEIEAGRLTVSGMKQGPLPTPALLSEGQGPSPVPDLTPIKLEAPMNAVTETAQAAPTELDEAAQALLQKLIGPMRSLSEERDSLQYEVKRLNDDRGFLADDINELRARVHTLQKQLDDRDLRIHELQTEEKLYLQERERFVTLAAEAVDTIQRMQKAINGAVVEGIERDRERRRPPSVQAASDPGVTMTPIRTQALLSRLANELNVSEQEPDIFEPEQPGQHEAGSIAPGAGDDGQDIPQFLKDGPQPPRERGR